MYTGSAAADLVVALVVLVAVAVVASAFFLPTSTVDVDAKSVLVAALVSRTAEIVGPSAASALMLAAVISLVFRSAIFSDLTSSRGAKSMKTGSAGCSFFVDGKKKESSLSYFLVSYKKNIHCQGEKYSLSRIELY